MRSALTAVAIVATLTLVGSAQAGGPVTKQNGSSPVLNFTPICAVAGYADYGLCGGLTSTFSGVGGKLNAIQPKLGTYNLEFVFSGLTPATEYNLLSTRDAVPFGGTWVEVSRSRRGCGWGRHVLDGDDLSSWSRLRSEQGRRRHHDHNVVVVGPEAGEEHGHHTLAGRLSQA